MITPTIPPAPKRADVDAVLALIQLASDPKAAKDLIQQLGAAAEVARDVIGSAKREQTAAELQKIDVADQIAHAREQHDQHIAASRAELEADAAKRKLELDTREEALASREEILKEDEAEVATLKADLKRRLASIKSAMEG